jgi:hypothetical protein
VDRVAAGDRLKKALPGGTGQPRFARGGIGPNLFGILTPTTSRPDPRGVTADALATADAEQMFCYRHPTTETWLRCGRCDRPICTKCSIQGPVGSRCRECGRLSNDPLTSFTARQLVLGTAASVVAGAIAGFASAYIGFFSIVVGYFAGRLVADAVTRVIGYKRGPVMLTILFGGIILGCILGFGAQDATYFAQLPVGYEVTLGAWLQSVLPSVLISAGAACFGRTSDCTDICGAARRQGRQPARRATMLRRT